MKVYLAGPITGQHYSEATVWRYNAESLLTGVGIKAYSPMRGKAYLSNEDKLEDTYSNFTMSSITGINVRDYNDVKTADALLVNFIGCGKRISIGTVMEIAWARAHQIPVVIVMEKDNVHQHGMLTFGNIVVEDLETGVECIKQILLP